MVGGDLSELIDGHKQLAKTAKRIRKGLVIPGNMDSDRRKEMRECRRALKAIVKAYVYTLRYVARGVASTTLGSL